jgi:hypothetical protein
MTNILLKIKYSFISTLVFFIVANPEFYSFTSSIFGSFSGIILHSVIFFFVMLALMTIPRNT